MRYTSVLGSLFAVSLLLTSSPVEARDSLSTKAKFAARVCLSFVETGKVDEARLQKYGYAPINKRKKQYKKYVQATWKDKKGRAHSGKSLDGWFILEAKTRKKKPNFHCSFEMSGKSPGGNALVQTASPAEKAAAKAFVSHISGRGYKLQLVKKKPGMGNGHDRYFVKGNTRIRYGESGSVRQGTGRRITFYLTRK